MLQTFGEEASKKLYLTTCFHNMPGICVSNYLLKNLNFARFHSGWNDYVPHYSNHGVCIFHEDRFDNVLKALFHHWRGTYFLNDLQPSFTALPLVVSFCYWAVCNDLWTLLNL